MAPRPGFRRPCRRRDEASRQRTGKLPPVKEVSCGTVDLLRDALEHRGIDVDALWAGLPHPPRARGPGRVDWEVWVELMRRAEEASRPVRAENLFVRGAGRRAGHPFIGVASSILSIRDLYALLARWGMRRSMTVMTARFENAGGRTARLGVSIAPHRLGSLPTLRFAAGMLRELPGLLELPPAELVIADGATPHHAMYEIVLPADPPVRSRIARFVRAARGARATFDELEAQATEIADTSAELTQRHAELERSTETVRDREAWLELALDAGRIGIWEWLPDTRRVRLSEGLATLLGVSGHTEIDTSVWTALIHPEDQPTIARIMGDAVRTGSPFEGQYRMTGPSGDWIWIRIKGRMIRDAGSGTMLALGAAVDVTESKRIEEQLRAADRLIAAGSLAAGIAHEINNPLTYVTGHLELVRGRLDAAATPTAVFESLEHVFDGLRRIRDVVADVRAFAQAGDDPVTCVDPRVACEGAIRIVSSSVRHVATLTTSYDAGTPLVNANESRLGQVVVNLIVNASHAMPDRPVAENAIAVRTYGMPSGECAIEVHDNGSGVPPEVLPRLFDPFFTTKAAGGGAGLGLAVCERIVRALGGRISVDTAADRGTTFTVVLPAATEAPRPAAATVAPPTAPRRVLVIDDEPQVRRVIVELLSGTGHEVLERADGRSALDLLRVDRQFDAVLCDLMMPGLDGVGLFEELEATAPCLTSRVVMISGGAVTDRARAFIARERVQTLPKPFTFEQLVDAIERVAQRSGNEDRVSG